MKCLFLDCDGVINNQNDMRNPDQPDAGSVFDRDYRNWNKKSVRVLDAICEKSGTKVVISSTWRKIHRDINWWNEQFSLAGTSYVEIIGTTPDSNSGFRGGEINEWLEENKHLAITHYVITDDDSDFFPDQPFVRIDSEFGLTEKYIPQILGYLT